MPVLASFLGSIFSFLFSWFGTFLSTRVATYVTFATAIAGAYLVLQAAVDAALSAVSVAMPEAVSIAIGWVMPSNTDACLSAVFAVEAAVAGYRWHKDVLRAATGLA